MQPTETVLTYHERTKHHPDRYAASLGYMDWANQPDPFRRYHGAPLLPLPLEPETQATPYRALFDETRPPEPLTLASLSRLLRYALGLAAWKSTGNDRWALRCNASSGNLHPTEATVILPPVEGVSTRSVIAHYAPKEHGLELLAEFDTGFWEALPPGSLLVALGSVVWRESWKYGERAFRYTQLDAGHAWRALDISARRCAWQTRRLETVAVSDLERLTGADQLQRYPETEGEIADMLLLVSPSPAARPVELSSLIAALPRLFAGRANRLSPEHQHWEAIDDVERATRADPSPLPATLPETPWPRDSTENAEKVILGRRSAREMDITRATISREAFDTLMRSVRESLDGREPAADLVLFIHAVEGVVPGLYLLLRNPEHRKALQAQMRDALLWRELSEHFFLLEEGNMRPQAKFICCSQDIAADGAFSLGMLCPFEAQIKTYGPQRYKELFWECGAIGQQLYLEATSLGLSATGIGCYLDDVMHRLLGLDGNRFQILYHFTVGRAIVDTRLTTLPPYTP